MDAGALSVERRHVTSGLQIRREGVSAHSHAWPVANTKQARLLREAVAVAFALLVVAGVLAIRAGLGCTGLLGELEITQPTLAAVPPTIAASPAPGRAHRVILVIVDGLRERDSHDLPALDRLRRAGASTVARSHYPTWSRPNYVSILTGVPPEASGVRTNRHHARIALDSVMDRVEAAGRTCVLTSDCEELPQMFLRLSSEGAPRAPCDSAGTPRDIGPEETAATIATNDAALVVLLVGDVDRAGHADGAASDAYRAAARQADNMLAQVLAGVDLQRDAVIVTADHGHIDRGGHGGIERDVVEVPLVAAGAGIRRGAQVEGARLIDIAPTIAALLGLPAPGHALGRTLVEVLELTPEALRDRVAADRERFAVTHSAAAGSRAHAEAALAASWPMRALIALATALLVIAVGGVLVRRRVIRIDHRVLALGAVVATVPYAAAFALGASSASAQPSWPELVPELLIAGGCVIAGHLRACARVVRRHRDPVEQLAAANAIAALGLLIAAVPACAVWLACSSLPLVLPGPSWLATIPVVFAGATGASVTIAIGLAGSLFAWRATCRRARW